MDDNAVAVATPADPRQQVAQQLTKSLGTSGSDGAKSSVFSQLTANPFFTAVCRLGGLLRLAI